MNNRTSYSIPMSFKVNEALLQQLSTFCNSEGISYSAAIRAGLSLLLVKKARNNTSNTRQSAASSW